MSGVNEDLGGSLPTYLPTSQNQTQPARRQACPALGASETVRGDGWMPVNGSAGLSSVTRGAAPGVTARSAAAAAHSRAAVHRQPAGLKTSALRLGNGACPRPGPLPGGVGGGAGAKPARLRFPLHTEAAEVRPMPAPGRGPGEVSPRQQFSTFAFKSRCALVGRRPSTGAGPAAAIPGGRSAVRRHRALARPAAIARTRARCQAGAGTGSAPRRRGGAPRPSVRRLPPRSGDYGHGRPEGTGGYRGTLLGGPVSNTRACAEKQTCKALPLKVSECLVF
ncbi:translation initiation factor IF-2-like [Falco naumanni]|uniref:translation initiation factor IF-2-like n=1 Tax=Falco naumanni TaxID=148594 RepID=UPI001ADE6A3C|nr:translation initiation factor IF-2-like [Falco naumanni]